MRVSLAVIGACGGATRQAVSQRGDRLGWLQSRFRRSVIPGPGRRGYRKSYGTLKGLKGRVVTFLGRARRGLQALPGSLSGGRPVARDPGALAELLGVSGGGTLFEVLVRWAKREMGILRRVLWGHSGWTRAGLAQYLDDAWWPRRRIISSSAAG